VGAGAENLSTYTAPATIVDVRFPVTESALSSVKRRLQDIAAATRDVAKTPAPTVLADRSPTNNALQVVVKFSPGNADADVVKSEIIESAVAAPLAAESPQSCTPGHASDER
jgi:hypothetical protein